MTYAHRSAIAMSCSILCSCFQRPNVEGRRCDSNVCPSGYVCTAERTCHAASENDPIISPPNQNDGGGPLVADTGAAAEGGGRTTSDAGGDDGATLLPAPPPPQCASNGECTTPRPCELATNASCINGRCVYEAVTCTSPPAAECLQNDSVLRSYSSPGECVPATGACSYASIDVACTSCSLNCLQVCQGVVCPNGQGGCTAAVCVPTMGSMPGHTCQQTTQPDGTLCALSAGPLGNGVCSAGQCVQCLTPRDCDDGNPCTIDQCQSNVCSHQEISCGQSPGVCYEAQGICDPTRGVCTYAPLPPGTACSSSALCPGESAICDAQQACLYPMTQTISTTYPVLQGYLAACDGTTEGFGAGCLTASNRFCASRQCTNTGFGPVEANGGLAIVVCLENAYVNQVPFTTLASFQPPCDGTTETYGLACNSAIHRYCASIGYASGVGPVETGATFLIVACVPNPQATVIATTFTALSGHLSSCTAATPFGGPCSAAINRFCAAQGYVTGFGPVEANADTAYVACLSR